MSYLPTIFALFSEDRKIPMGLYPNLRAWWSEFPSKESFAIAVRKMTGETTLPRPTVRVQRMIDDLHIGAVVEFEGKSYYMRRMAHGLVNVIRVYSPFPFDADPADEM